MDQIQRAGGAPKPGRRGSRGACAAIALASAMLVGGTGAAIAQVPAPQANHAWGGCLLTPDAVTELEKSITGAYEEPNGFFDTSGDFKVSFVIVYALKNDNDGQPLKTGGKFTGVILCRDPGEVDIETTTETTVLPDVDILDIEQTFVLQYFNNDGDGKEKRVCQTTDSNTDCFRLFPESE